MSTPKHPKLDLAQAIIAVIGEKTGREVRAAEIHAFSDYLSVSVALAEDGALEVEFSDPLDPYGASTDDDSGQEVLHV